MSDEPTHESTPDTDTDKPIERDGSAPVQQADTIEERVDVVGLLSDEFGVSRSVIRKEILMGSMTLDGTEIPSALDLDRETSQGKTLEVIGGDTNRTYRVQIAAA
jgi:hypothetical protein